MTLDDVVKGDNTDGAGLVKDIEINLGVPFLDKNILIVGAGGAVRGILSPILERSPNLIVIANRTKGKADELEKIFSDFGNVKAFALHEADSNVYDIIINATSTGIHGELPQISPRIFENTELVYDLVYGKHPTRFMEWAKENNVDQIADGLGMLVEQAAESFNVWHGVVPQTIPVIQAVREKL